MEKLNDSNFFQRTFIIRCNEVYQPCYNNKLTLTSHLIKKRTQESFCQCEMVKTKEIRNDEAKGWARSCNL